MKVLLLAITLSFAAASTATAQIKWMSWEEAVAANAKAPKKVFVDVYTDWCGWCKRMDAATFSDKSVAAVINENFYAVKLDAEQKEAITFRDKVYEFQASGRRGAHGLAIELLQGRMGYPTVVFLDEDLEVIQPVPGFQDKAAMLKVATYFGTDVYRSTPWNEYTGK